MSENDIVLQMRLVSVDEIMFMMSSAGIGNAFRSEDIQIGFSNKVDYAEETDEITLDFGVKYAVHSEDVLECVSFRRCAGMCMPVQVLCSRFETLYTSQCQRQQRNDNPHYASSSECCCRNHAWDTHRKDSRNTSCQISFADAGYKKVECQFV